jgi:hypothetical protein
MTKDEIIAKLWDLLDSIDTYADLQINGSETDKCFSWIENKAQERHKLVKSDGYDLFIGNEKITKQKHSNSAKMSEWIDYNMIISEIGMHRGNAQMRIKEYRELEKQRRLSDGEKIDYAKCVGEEVILMCLQQWCNDFRFSTDELKGFEEFKK